MENVYTVREFRSKLREALDKCTQGESVHIKRGDNVYTLTNGVHKKSKGSEGGRRDDKVVVIKTKEDASEAVAGEYGCGCKKSGGKILCPKHGRY